MEEGNSRNAEGGAVGRVSIALTIVSGGLSGFDHDKRPISWS